MTSLVALSVLLAALLHAVWNALIKGSADARLQTAAACDDPAMTVSPISLVAALRETSVLLAAVIGSHLLRERLTWLHWAGVAAVAAGIAATRIG